MHTVQQYDSNIGYHKTMVDRIRFHYDSLHPDYQTIKYSYINTKITVALFQIFLKYF